MKHLAEEKSAFLVCQIARKIRGNFGPRAVSLCKEGILALSLSLSLRAGN
jgi:hypothetical protein